MSAELSKQRYKASITFDLSSENYLELMRILRDLQNWKDNANEKSRTNERYDKLVNINKSTLSEVVQP